VPIKRVTPKKTVTKLSPERHAVLDAIRAYRRAHSKPPTFSEVATAVGISRRTVRDHVERLKKDGYVTYEDGGHRSLLVTRKGQRVPDMILRAMKKSKPKQ
jgi:Mn-dependent DtxR family transcriptional regulator